MTHTPEMPADCELPSDGTTLTQPSAVRVRAEAPAVAERGALTPAHGPSVYLTYRPRTFAEAVRDVSKYRDMDPWVYDELQHHRHTATIVCLAQARAERRRKP